MTKKILVICDDLLMIFYKYKTELKIGYVMVCLYSYIVSVG